MRQSTLAARCFVGVLLALSALLFFISKSTSDEKRLEKTIARKAAQGRMATTEVYVQLWEPRAARINSLLCLALALCWPVLNRKTSPLAATPDVNKPQAQSRWFWFAVAAWVLTISIYDAQRLNLSLWNDEEATMRQCVVGSLAKGEDGRAMLKEVPWLDTFFNYRRPNNHIFYSALAKLCHSWYPSPTDLGPNDTFFSAPLLRLPAFIAGAGALFVVVCLGLHLGGKRLGVAALLLFSLHPWFTRYSTEARAYGLIFLLAASLWLALIKATSDGGWRWWLLFALSSLLLLWTWPLSLWIVLSANCAAVILVWRSAEPRDHRWTLLGRWFVCQFVAGMVFLQVFLPNIIQMRQFMATNRIKGLPMTVAWLADAASALFTGSGWIEHDASNPISFCWQRVWDQYPVAVAVAGLLLAAIFAVGIVQIATRSRVGWWLVVAVLAPLAFTLLFAALTRSVILVWYTSPFLPGIALVLAAGVDGVSKWFSLKAGPRWVVVSALCVGFALLTHPRRRLLCQYSVDPNKEAAQLVHKVFNPLSPEYGKEPPVSGYFLPMDSYIPFLESTQNAVDLRARRVAAQKSGTDYFIIVGNATSTSRLDTEIMKELNQSEHWDLLALLFGTEGGNARAVYKSKR